MDYQVIIVDGEDCPTLKENLEKKVRKEIKNGWKPLGGISISQEDTGRDFWMVLAQAMIKE